MVVVLLPDAVGVCFFHVERSLELEEQHDNLLTRHSCGVRVRFIRFANSPSLGSV